MSDIVELTFPLFANRSTNYWRITALTKGSLNGLIHGRDESGSGVDGSRVDGSSVLGPRKDFGVTLRVQSLNTLRRSVPSSSARNYYQGPILLISIHLGWGIINFKAANSSFIYVWALNQRLVTNHFYFTIRSSIWSFYKLNFSLERYLALVLLVESDSCIHLPIKLNQQQISEKPQFRI